MWCMNEEPSFTCPHTIQRKGEDWLSVSDETASAFRVDISTGVGVPSTQDKHAELSQNYPNPFFDRTDISYSLKEPDHVSLSVFDMMGQEIMTLVNEYLQAGDYNITFNATGLPSGIYLYSLHSGHHLIEVRKMNCIR